jgi:FtsP/CotA-like multicopper oxidase with cupredoxin domain
MNTQFYRKLVAVLTSMAVALTGAIPVALAGPGITPATSNTGQPVMAPTYYANSPLGVRPDLVTPSGPGIDTGTALRKFVDVLPGIPGLAPSTNAGTGVMPNGDTKYIPLAVPDVWPGDLADYYHLAIVEYQEQMHSDLPKATTLRGYVQIEEPGVQPALGKGSKHIQLFYPNGTPIQLTDANGTPQNVYAYDKPHYLGPTIIAHRNVPTRIKWSNLLPPGAFDEATGQRMGDLPIPVDATLAGGALPQNRAAIHLHGGLSPWISDGTPHQWTMPVGETRYGYVSDMAVTAVGAGYTTAPTVSIDPPQGVAAAMAVLNGTTGVDSIVPTRPGSGYVPGTPPAVTVAAPTAIGGGTAATASATLVAHAVSRINALSAGFGYVIAPSVTVSAPPSSVSATATSALVATGTAQQKSAVASATLSTGGGIYSSTPSVSFAAPPAAVQATASSTLSGDSVGAIAVGTGGYGYWTAPLVTIGAPTAPGVAATATPTVRTTTGAISALAVNAGTTGYATAPTVTFPAPPAALNGVGTPTVNPATGALTAIAVNAANFGYWTAPTIVVAAPTASRATALVSTAKVATVTNGGAGYLTAPFVGVAGGTRISGLAWTATATVVAGKVTAITVVGTGVYTVAPTLTIATGTAGTRATATATVANGKITAITLTNAGTGYDPVAVPTVSITTATPGVRATATATVAGGAVTAYTITNAGSGYNPAVAPTVSVSLPGGAGTQATATATVANGVVTGFTVTNAGTGYLAAPTITLGAPTASVAATGTATFNALTGAVSAVTLTSGGTGYVTAPVVTISAPAAATTATVTATISASTHMVTGYTITSAGWGYQTAPTVTVAAPPAPVQATARANVAPDGSIGGFTITNAGAGYFSPPTVTVAWPANAVQATATASIGGGGLTAVTITNRGGGYTATPNVTISGGAGSGATAAALIETPVGVSFRQVPDMVGNAVGPVGYTPPTMGEGTLYYTNQQSERLMWYHDHTSGTTRLNAYMGEAAPYLILDTATEGPLAAAGLPQEIIPLVLQDKTFVPADIMLEDANWDTRHWGQPGDLWFPHVYETNQNPSFWSSSSQAGRWDWGPWFAIVYPSMYALPSGQYGDVTTTPEAFQDTAVVNGVAYPTLTVEPKAYRFLMLNGSNDRFLNVGFYVADPLQVRAGDGAINTEVLAGPNFGDQPTNYPGNVFHDVAGNSGLTPWPTDGRWAPLPSEMGPPMYQIGNEAGMLPFWVQQDAIPVNYDYNRGSVTVLNISQDNDVTQTCYPKCHGLYLGGAERADVVVDFSPYAGRTLILYNDAPSPNPGYSPRLDYYTDNDPGNAGNYPTGGAPNTETGYGPNVRTLMQVIVLPAPVAAAFDPTTLGVGRQAGQLVGTTGPLQNVYVATQAPPIVGESIYNVVGAADTTGAFSTAYTDQYADMFLASQNEPMFFVTNPGPLTVTGIAVTGQTTATGAASGVGLGGGASGSNPAAGSGTGYTYPPAVAISAPAGCTLGTTGCAVATATATVTAGEVTAITLTDPGAGYTEAPSVNVVAAYTVGTVGLTNGGSGYVAAPAVTISGGGGSGAAATATLVAGRVTGVTVTTAGTGYTTQPTVTIAPPPLIAATGSATLSLDRVAQVLVASGGTYASPSVPTVTFSAPPPVRAARIIATPFSGICCIYTVMDGGSGYLVSSTLSVRDPSVTPARTGATAQTVVTNGVITGVVPLTTGPLTYMTAVLSAIPAPTAVAIRATGTAVMDPTGTFVSSVNVTNGGGNYITGVPTVTFTGGARATAVASLLGGGTGATAVALTSRTTAFVVPAALPNSGVPLSANAKPVALPPGLATMMGCNAAQTLCTNAAGAVIGRLMNPAIQELFEPFYGRMNATLGIEMPNQSLAVQTTLPLNYVDPATEQLEPNTVQMWKVTHNGVDAHPVHFHLVNVQVVNRVGWDGTVKPPEDNEIGWKETVKMNPLEDIIVAMRVEMPKVPFGLDRSVRAQDPSLPLGVNMGFTQFAIAGLNGNAPNGLPVPAGAIGVGDPAQVVNSLEDYDNEYVWHCHILGHEENDFMRPLVATSQTTAPDAPGSFVLTQASAGAPVVATWVDPTPVGAAVTTLGNAKNELGFKLERCVGTCTPTSTNWQLVAVAPSNVTTISDLLLSPVRAGALVNYRLYGYNAATIGKLVGGSNTGVGVMAYATITAQ